MILRVGLFLQTFKYRPVQRSKLWLVVWLRIDNKEGLWISGIESKLEYLADLGVETIWLSPIYESPMADFGYDISNFTNVDGLFGTLADFQRMSERAHELGKKLSNETCLCIFTVCENVIMTKKHFLTPRFEN